MRARRDSLPMRIAQRSLSIRYRLPLLICGLLLVVAIAFSWAVYLEVRRAALLAARERLGNVTRQMSDLLRNSGRQMTTQARALAAHPSVLRDLRSPRRQARLPVLAALDSAARRVEAIVAIELWAADGSRQLRTERPAPPFEPETARELFNSPGAADSGIVGPFRQVRDSLYYSVVTPVLDQGRTLGFLVQHRRITGSSESARQLRELIGSGAALFVGNQRGDVWTDFARPAESPPVAVSASGDSLLQYEREPGGWQLASAAPIPGTAWLVLMEFPRAPVLQGARRVAQRLGMVTLVLLALGGAGAWAVSRSLTGPLSDVASAADAIAHGDYGRRVIVARRDELGELAEAFNIMAQTVEESQRRLEEQVVERTAQLRASEEQFRSLAVTANDAIITADARGCITYVNPGAQHIFGYSATELLEQPLTVLMPERFHDPHRRGLARYLAGGEARVVGRTVELAGRRKDGTEFPLELSLASWNRGPDPSFGAIIRDITARKETEAAIQGYAADLEAANQELEAFSYSVSHDLRAPLRSIDGFCQALLEDCGDQLDETGQEHLHRVRAASQRMGALIDDLLKLARVTRAELRPEPLSLSALAESIVADLRRIDSARQVDVMVAPQVEGRGDRQLVRLVLDNLLNNAWKFTRKCQRPRIEFGVALRQGRPAYFVRDNGAGFDRRYASKLFTPFQRLHSTNDFEGTGIGLATVQRVVLRHGGQVWADGDLNQGATFYFTLAPPGAQTS